MEDNKKKSFPGYPQYPSDEDITNRDNSAGKKDINVENIPNSHSFDTPTEKNAVRNNKTNDDNEEENFNPDRAELDNEDEDGDALNEETIDDDLDIPGSEADDEDENIGEEDEENNYYSLGGDDKEGLEEDQGD